MCIPKIDDYKNRYTLPSGISLLAIGSLVLALGVAGVVFSKGMFLPSYLFLAIGSLSLISGGLTCFYYFHAHRFLKSVEKANNAQTKKVSQAVQNQYSRL